MHLSHSHQQRSESFPVGALLALSGGFLDAYTYITRGGVFANAQTGNMVFFGIHLAEGQWSDSIRYLFPIVAFAAGILLAEWIHSTQKNNSRLHWRQIILAIECCILFALGFIPSGVCDAAVNIAVSFVCALQVQSFRTVHGLSYATTMCTGNLRSGTELLFFSIQRNDRTLLLDSFKYFAIIVIFTLGAAAGYLSSQRFGERSIFIPCVLLLFVLMFLKRNATSGPVNNTEKEGESQI